MGLVRGVFWRHFFKTTFRNESGDFVVWYLAEISGDEIPDGRGADHLSIKKIFGWALVRSIGANGLTMVLLETFGEALFGFAVVVI